MAITQRELALQMLAQLRVLDPSVSAEVGTPERKIIDTVAQALSDAQIDLTQLSGALDIDSKFGSTLDNFLALFGFGRQEAVRATGFVTFGRNIPSTMDIRVPVGTQVMAGPAALDELGHGFVPYYETTFEVTLPAGQTSIVAPVRAVVAGAASNVAANQVTQQVGTPVYGITEINNDNPITGGADREDDDAYKVRFKNTVFRNLAGTQDQYMALAAATAFTTKANVVGPISRYREYVQIPLEDDSQPYNVDPAPDSTGETGNGNPNEWTTALSTVPYSDHTYDNVPTFVSNGKTGTQTVFYREGVDWDLNTTSFAKNRGDAYRQAHSSSLPHEGMDPESPEAINRPNITVYNVYEGVDPRVTAPRPGDTVLFEHSYLSNASRNDYSRNVMNAVDLFIDGSNNTVASTVVPSPGVTTSGKVFVNSPTTHKYFRENYRRFGEPDIPPTAGHLFIPLFWQPVVELPPEIIVADEIDSAIFYLGEHYWLVEDVTELYGTVRARNGIEWNLDAKGALSAQDGSFGARTGKKLNEFAAGLSIDIENYIYDKNIVDLQAALDAQKQVTTDVLVHRARKRYLKLDITVMYAPGFNTNQVNAEIRSNLERFLAGQYFGNAIQLSDLLQVVHAVAGVDNVRWSSDVPGSEDAARVAETNYGGTTRPSETDALSPRVFASDFFLTDDELPTLSQEVDDVGGFGKDADATRAAAREFAALPGLLIRSRAQNTWTKS
jgi:hypothetical protein